MGTSEIISVNVPSPKKPLTVVYKIKISIICMSIFAGQKNDVIRIGISARIRNAPRIRKIMCPLSFIPPAPLVYALQIHADQSFFSANQFRLKQGSLVHPRVPELLLLQQRRNLLSLR